MENLQLPQLSCMNTQDPQTGAIRAPDPGLRFAMWYNVLQNPKSVVKSIAGPPISKSIPTALRPAFRVVPFPPKIWKTLTQLTRPCRALGVRSAACWGQLLVWGCWGCPLVAVGVAPGLWAGPPRLFIQRWKKLLQTSPLVAWCCCSDMLSRDVVLFCAQRQYKLYLSCIPCLFHVLHAMP